MRLFFGNLIEINYSYDKLTLVVIEKERIIT